MSGLLNGGGMSGMSGMGAAGVDPMQLLQLLQLLQMAKSDPFSKSMPGSNLLGDGKLSGQEPQMSMEQNIGQQPQLRPQMPGENQVISTDFADTQPGLPNLPDSFQGFGYGQFAPQTHEGNPLRQQLIKQLLDMLQKSGGLQSMPGMGGAMDGGMPTGFLDGMGGF